VKVRGNASHVAEKYVNLARDASLSGDLVASENYLQHAEHYFRLVAAAQTQIRQDQATNRPRHGGDQPNPRPPVEGADSDEAGDVGQDKSGSEAGPSEDAAERAEDGRSAGRNRRPAADRKSAKSENGDVSNTDTTDNQAMNGADAGEDQMAEVEAEKIAKASSGPGDESVAPEDVAEAEAEL